MKIATKTATALFLLSLPFVSVSTGSAATQVQECRTTVNKQVAAMYRTVVLGAAKCFKARMADGGSQDCLDPAVFDEADKLTGARNRLVAAMTDTPTSACGALGAGFFLACTEPPASCAAECVCAQGSTGAQIASCLGCRVIAVALGQAGDIFGGGVPSPDDDAQGCQNAIGKSSAKYGRTLMKDEQSCQADYDAGEGRMDCRTYDDLGKVAKAQTKSESSVLKACLQTPGVDQVPELTGAACDATDANGAAACAVDAPRSAVDEIFRIASSPAGIFGFVTVTGNDGIPLPLRGVRVEVPAASAGTLTDRTGYYEVVGVPPGNRIQVIDGQAVGPYPRIGRGFPAPMAGLCPMGIFPMPAIDLANGMDVASLLDGTNHLTSPVTLANPTIPGASLDLPAGTLLTFDVPNRRPLLSVSVVPVAAMPFPPDVLTDEIFTFQPEGLAISPAAVATFPNNLGLSIGEQANVWLPDFVTNTFELAGTATVQAPGDTMTTDTALIGRFDWNFVADPDAPVGCTTTLIGRVVDADTLAPIVNAQVSFFGSFTSTLADGTFSFLLEVCPTTSIATVAAQLPTALFASAQSMAATVFNGVTDFGDIGVTIPDCGNGVFEVGELCDDGDNDGGDGCGPSCNLEVCGDNVVDPPAEECDGTAGCTDFCTVCGNGILSTPGEECDAGVQNGIHGSGCSANCRISICGNGVREDGEECDDGIANGGMETFCEEECTLKVTAKFRGSLIRSASQCLLPNTTTQGTVDACTPLSLASAFTFDSTGGGEVEAGFVRGGDDVSLSAIVHDVGPPALTTGIGWQMRWSLRVTLFGFGGAGDVTLADLDVVTPMTLLTDQLVANASLAGVTGLVLSDYTSKEIELLDAAVLDPNGDVFARLGILTGEGTPAFSADRPESAGDITSTFVIAYEQCTFPNTTVAGLDACQPVTTSSPYTLSPDGHARFDADATPDPDIAFRSSLTGVIDTDGITPANGLIDSGFHLVPRLRISKIDAVNGDMTVVDFPVPLEMSVPEKGDMAVSSTLNEWLAGAGTPVLVEQAQVAVIGAQIQDPDGRPFMGIGIRSPGR